MTDTNNAELDTRVTPINPKGRGGWVAVAVALIMAWEGFAPVGYHDRIDPKNVNTIGYGHIENVTIGERITKVQAGVLLSKDLPRYEKQVERCIKVPMPGYRHAAIISFTYNVGGGALCKSSVARYINADEWQKGCDALLLYDKANGRTLPGLENRRKAERKLCYNVNEPPLPDSEVMKEKHVNVDQATADKEAAAAAVAPTQAKAVKAAVTVLPKQEQPHAQPNGIMHWLMEQ
jgi:lysozyme